MCWDLFDMKQRELDEFAEVCAKEAEQRSNDMTEYIHTKEQIVEIGDKISVPNYGSPPFEIKKNGSTTNVAFNKDGEYIVSIFDGKVIVTTSKHSQGEIT